MVAHGLTKHLKGAEPSAQAPLLLLTVALTPACTLMGTAGAVATWPPWRSAIFCMHTALQLPQASTIHVVLLGQLAVSQRSMSMVPHALSCITSQCKICSSTH